MILLVVYRPPPNKKNGSLVVDFFKEFADILDIYATLPDELVIFGDFNFNFDINTDVHVRRFRYMLDSHGMTQYVEVPRRSHFRFNYRPPLFLRDGHCRG